MASPRDPSTVWRGNHPWAAVYDRIASDERVGPLLWRVGMGSDLGLLHRYAARELAAVGEDGAVLDIPCGGGVTLRDVPAGRVLRYVAADIAPDMLERTRREAGRRGVAVELREADAQALGFADGEFDLVLAFTSLHCFPQPAAAVLELHRVLRPGGRLCGSALLTDTGLAFEPMQRAGRLLGLLGPSGTTPDLVGWLADAGFADVRLERSGGLTYFSASRPWTSSRLRCPAR